MGGDILFGNDIKVVSYLSDAPYERVWPAIKRATRKFALESRRPIIGVDDENGVVQNGQITQDRTIGASVGSTQDQFFSKAIRAGAKVKIEVTRKVVVMDMTGKIKMQNSNGNYENYLLTLIDNEIAKGGIEDDSEIKADKTDYSKTAPGKYVNKDNATQYIELKSDKSFFLKENGSHSGKYEVNGNVLTIVLGNGQSARANFKGNTVIDELGKVWVKQNSEPATNTSSSQTSASTSSSSTEILTNVDVIRMVKAGLPDSVIIAKIKSSKCKFDTSTDGLVKLKQAGLSNPVLQAVVEAPNK